MPAVIKINGVAASDTDIAIDTVVQLDNATVESTYAWTIVDQPPGPDDTLSAPAIKNPTIHIQKEGTYVIKLVVNAATGTEATDVKVAAVRQLKTRERVPGATETIQADATDGWAESLNDSLRRLDTSIADPGIVVGSAGTAGLQRGAICKVSDLTTIKVGLPGEEKIPKFVRALATLSTNVHGLLGILLNNTAGSTSPANGDICYFRIFGLIGNFAGAPVINDPVFVDDAGDFSLTEGTYRRLVGFVASSGGGFYSIWYDGRVFDYNPTLVSEDLKDSAVGVSPAGGVRYRSFGGVAQLSENGGPYVNVVGAVSVNPITFSEIADPAAPGANQAKLYARDNGLASPNNRTQLAVRWPDGTITVIAESPAA